jgi:hypothetical protein
MNMRNSAIAIPEPENIFSFNFLRDLLWARRKMIIGATALGFIMGLAVAISTGGKYTVSMTLIPSETDLTRDTGIQLSSILSNGADLPVSKFKQFQAELYSYRTAELLDHNYGVLCEISPTRCDFKTHTWKPKAAWRKTLSLATATLLGMPPAPDTPQVSDLVEYIKDTVTLTTEKTSSLTIISMESRDLERSKLFLTRLVDAANQTIRERDRADLTKYVDYVSNRIESLTAVAQRPALDALLLTEERRLMLTNVQVAYAATTLDGPNAVRSNAALKIAISVAAGFILGGVLAIILEFASGSTALLKPEKHKPSLHQKNNIHDV